MSPQFPTIPLPAAAIDQIYYLKLILQFDNQQSSIANRQPPIANRAVRAELQEFMSVNHSLRLKHLKYKLLVIVIDSAADTQSAVKLDTRLTNPLPVE